MEYRWLERFLVEFVCRVWLRALTGLRLRGFAVAVASAGAVTAAVAFAVLVAGDLSRRPISETVPRQKPRSRFLIGGRLLRFPISVA